MSEDYTEGGYPAESTSVGTAPAATETSVAPPPSILGRKRTVSPDHIAKMRAGLALAKAEGRLGRRRKTAKRAAPQASQEFQQKVETAAAMLMPGIEQGGYDSGPAPKPPPFSFPRPQENQNAPPGVPRLVRLSDVDAVIEQMWPLLVERYPTAHKEMVRPTLALATRGIRTRFWHTGDGGFALFEARQTPFEPDLVVHGFTLGRHAEALVAAGLKWARDTGAARFDVEQFPSRLEANEVRRTISMWYLK